MKNVNKLVKKEMDDERQTANLLFTSGNQLDSKDVRAETIEAMAMRMRAPGNQESLAVKYSVLKEFTKDSALEPVRWQNSLFYPFAFLLAIYMMIKMAFFRLGYLLRGGRDKYRLIFGPENGTKFFDGLHPMGYLARNGATTPVALDIAYNAVNVLTKVTGLKERFFRFWLNTDEAIGVRNRLRLSFLNIIKSSESKIASGAGSLCILSLACGSAQATIEALAYIRERFPLVNIRLTLVDLNESALRMAEYLAQSRDLLQYIDIRLENIREFLLKQQDCSWDIVEMVGFLDYRNDKSFINNCSMVRGILKSGGVFITSNICPTKWTFVSRWVLNWPFLIRRSRERFLSMLLRSGFKDTEVTCEYIPTKTHVVAVCMRR